MQTTSPHQNQIGSILQKPPGNLLIRAEGISKTFKKGDRLIPVLSEINLDIAIGETIAITGPSGVGKSTLLHILGTLEKPTTGQVIFSNETTSGGQNNAISLFKMSEKNLARFRNRALGFVFQFHYLLPEFTAMENVMMPALIGGASKNTVQKQAKELLEQVGLEKRVDHRPSELSGGEQQRVAIARALLMRPRLLLADEPTGNLDSVNGAKVVDLVLELSRSRGTSVLLVTHDSDLAKKMHRVVSMKDGKIAR